MSQRSVEQVIGRLVTDEGFRRRFGEDRHAVLQELRQAGTDLTTGECRALAGLDLRLLERCALAIDPRLQQVDLGCTPSRPGRAMQPPAVGRG
ncbi:MAG: Os1348 family NHLP clan protein [Candidatus Latescibacterota bacterium]